MSEQAIFMLNALWFKKEGGIESYQQYIQAVAPLLKEAGAEPQPAFQPTMSVIGDWEPDVFFVVRYPSRSAFQQMFSSEAYQRIKHLRENALDKSLLIECASFDFSGI